MEDKFKNDDLFEIDLDVLASSDQTLDSIASKQKESKNKEEENIKENDDEDTSELDLSDEVDADLLANLEDSEEDEDDEDSTDDSEEISSKETKTKRAGAETNSTSTPKTEQSSTLIISPLAKALYDEGVLAALSEEELAKIESSEDIIDAIKKQISENEYADLNENQKNYLELLRAGIPAESAEKAVSVDARINAITDEDVNTNPELRRAIMMQDFLSRGFSQEKATRLVQKSVESGEDVIDAKESLTSLKQVSAQRIQEAKDAAKAREIKTKEDNEKYVKELKSKVLAKDEIIKGIKINQPTKDKVFESMTKPAGYKNGKPLNAIEMAREEDPEEFEIKLHYLFNLTNGFKDFSKLNKISKSNSLKELEQKMNAVVLDGTGKSARNNDVLSSEGEGLLSAIRNF